MINKTIGGLNPKINKEIINSLHYYVLQFIRDNTIEGIESLLGHKKTAVLSQAMAFANKEIRKVGENTLREEERLLKEIKSLDATNEVNATKIEELSAVYMTCSLKTGHLKIEFSGNINNFKKCNYCL